MLLSTTTVLSIASLIAQVVAYPQGRPANVVRRHLDIAAPLQFNKRQDAPYVSTNESAITPNGNLPIVTINNTLNSTVPPPLSSNTTFPQAITGGKLQLTITNNFPGNGNCNAYVTGLDVNNRLVMLQGDGQWYYPTGNTTVPSPIQGNVQLPLGETGSTTTLTLPGWISAGRVWISQGTLQFFVVEASQGTWSLVEPSVTNPSDPNAYINFGFVELTNSATLGLFVNISFVDFVGLALGLSVTSSGSGGGSTTGTGLTQNVPGLSSTAASQICQDLMNQSSIDGAPWKDLCVNDPTSGDLIRVLAPQDYLSVNNGAFSDYWSSYVDQVWEKYSSEPLIINTQAAAGNVSCTVSGDSLSCDGDNRSYPKPSANDIFTCNTGTFAILGSDNDVHRAVVPRLCAGINRSTMLLDGGNYQPSLGSDSYYTVSPTNYYSKFVHQYEAGGIGYAFSYDDVTPDTSINQRGELTSTSPTQMGITIEGASG